MPSYYAPRASWRTPLFAALALLFLAPSAAAQSVSATAPAAPGEPSPYRGGFETLLDQSDGTQNGGLVSQINADASDFDAESGDDFTVPAGLTWTVNELTVAGFYSASEGVTPGVAESVRVAFYDNDNGSPGDLITEETIGAANFTDLDGTFTIPVTEQIFESGTYWLVVQAASSNLDFDVPDNVRRWDWFQSATGAGTAPAHLRNEGGAFDIGTDWVSFTDLGITPPNLDFILRGSSEGMETPDPITFMPDTVRAMAMTGMTASSSVTLMNNSDAPVDFSVVGFGDDGGRSAAAWETIARAPARTDRYVPSFETRKGERDAYTGEAMRFGAGGPDAFGYTWIDSNESGGPDFNFVDISGTGTALGLGDDEGSGSIALPFSFSFYGESYDQVFVNSNGWLSFTDPGAASGGGPSRNNTVLPTASAPNALVAVFWDDLDPSVAVADDIYVQDMGDGRFIVQWNEIVRFAQTVPQTFQAILDSSGDILLQYETVGGTLTSATAGVENASGTVGLTVVFNQPYLESGLAVSISNVPSFVSDVTPSSGTIPAGGSATLDIDFEAQLVGGTYEAVLTVETDANNVFIPLVYEVTGTPVLELSGDIEFDDITQGFPGTATLTLTNTGDDVLTVSDVTSGDDAFSVDFDGPVEIAAGESFDVAVTFDPDGTGDFVSMITVTSDGGTVMVNVSGTANSAGEIAVTPDTLTATAESGETATATLTIANEGVGDLLFSFLGFDDDPGRQAQMKARYEAQFGRSLAPAATQKGAPDTFTGGLENYLRAGGPDAFGYVYSDSNEPGGPMYAFEDISETGTALAFTSTDDGSASVTLPFGFPFYGDTKTDMLVSTNGYLTFSGSGTDFSNDPIPSEAAPNDIIAPFWDDLAVNPVANEGSAVYTQDMGDGRLIVQFENERLGDPDGPTTLSFQVVLSESGVIEFRYRSLASADLASATIGIENADGTDGLEVSANEAGYLEDELAIRFVAIAPFVTSVDPVSGSVESNGTQEVTVTFDAAGLNAGVYSGNLIIENNDSSQSTLLVPVQFTVTGQPNIGTDAIDDALAFGVVVAGADSVRTLTITNDGTDVLTFNPLITKGIGQNNAFEFVSDEVETIAPGSSFGLDIRFAPDEAGTYSATLVLQSNDPDSGDIEIALTGFAINAALPSVSVDDVDLEVIQGLTTTAEFTVSNDAAAGADALSFTVSIVQTDGPQTPAADGAVAYPAQRAVHGLRKRRGRARARPGRTGSPQHGTGRARGRRGDRRLVRDDGVRPGHGTRYQRVLGRGLGQLRDAVLLGADVLWQQPGLPAQLGRDLGMVWRHVPSRERLCRARSHGAFRQRRAHVLPPHPGAGRCARRHDGRAHGRRCAREL